MLDYFLKFTMFSKYSPSLVSDPRDEMSHFVMGMSDDFKEKCHSDIQHGNMNISHLMVHAQKVEKARIKKKSRYAYRSKSFDGSYSKVRLDIQDNTRFKKRLYIKFLRIRDDMVSNPKHQKGRGTS